MSLVWHLARKDLRRLAPAVGVWLALNVALALVLSLARVPGDVVRSGGVESWVFNLQITAGCLAGTAAVLGVLLTAQLVQEDPLVGAGAFWRTRPIALGQWLQAKALAVVLAFGVAPLAVMAIVWLANGFALGDWARSTAQWLGWQTTLTVAAAVLAAMTPHLAGFVFAMTGVVVWTVVLGSPLANIVALPADAAVQQTRIVGVGPLVVGCLLAAGAVHVLTRRAARAWQVLAIGGVVVLVGRLAWPWDSLPERPGVFGRWGPRRDDRASAVVWEKLALAGQPGTPPTALLTTTAGAAPDEAVAPWNGTGTLRTGAQHAELAFEAGPRWGEAATKRLLGLAPAAEPVRWVLATSVRAGRIDAWVPTDAAHLAATLRLAQVQARVVAELPWRAGESARDGGWTVRVISTGQLPGQLNRGVIVEERQPAAAPTFRDGYALVNRRLGIFQSLHVVERGSVSGAGLRLVERVLTYDAPTDVVNGVRGERPDWERDAVLVKVRFAVTERWQSPAVAERLAVVEETKP